MSCSTSALSGSAGSVTFTNSASEITTWSIDLTQEVLNATSFASSGWNEFILGLKGGTGSLTAIGDIPEVGEVASASFATGTTSDPTIAGDIEIGSVTYNVPVDGIVSYDATFTLCGEITVS